MSGQPALGERRRTGRGGLARRQGRARRRRTESGPRLEAGVLRVGCGKHVLVFGVIAILAAGALAPGGDDPRTATRDAAPTRGRRIDVARPEWRAGRSIDAPRGPAP